MAVPAFFVEREKKGFTNSLGLLDQTMSTKFRLIDFRLTFLILKRKFNCFSVCNFGSKRRIFFLLVFSCAGKKDSLGMDDEIRVICSETDEPIVRAYLTKVFNDTLYTPAPEPLFKLIFS